MDQRPMRKGSHPATVRRPTLRLAIPLPTSHSIPGHFYLDNYLDKYKPQMVMQDRSHYLDNVLDKTGIQDGIYHLDNYLDNMVYPG